jgi:hypothetical protein
MMGVHLGARFVSFECIVDAPLNLLPGPNSWSYNIIKFLHVFPGARPKAEVK